MLLLVFAHRHMGGMVGKDVRRHQIWIDIQPDGRILAILAGLVLELGHAVQPADARHAVEYPSELGMDSCLRLIEQNGTHRIDADSHAGGCHLPRGSRELGGLLPYGDRVHVDHTIDAGHAVLQPHPILHRAEIVSEMELAAGLNARKGERLVFDDIIHGASPDNGAPYRRARRLHQALPSKAFISFASMEARRSECVTLWP